MSLRFLHFRSSSAQSRATLRSLVRLQIASIISKKVKSRTRKPEHMAGPSEALTCSTSFFFTFFDFFLRSPSSSIGRRLFLFTPFLHPSKAHTLSVGPFTNMFSRGLRSAAAPAVRSLNQPLRTNAPGVAVSASATIKSMQSKRSVYAHGISLFFYDFSGLLP